MLKGCV